jgi:lysophospholipase L1-like esterase
MNTLAKPTRALLILGVSALIASRADAASMTTYISLGDSIAYGSGTTEDAAPGSTGTSGYVSQFASTLGQVNGGVAPNVFNLALPNETLSSFSSGNADTSANTLYSPSLTSQNMAFMHYMATQLAAGNQINTVTISLGTQDIMNILNQPGFGSMSLIQQATAVQAGLAQIQSEYSSLLGQIRNVLPNATIDLVGAYNPFHATPNSPLAPIAEPAFLGLNNILQQDASQYNATYVDTYTKFLGNEATFTNILNGTGSISPTVPGYSAIAAQLNSTIVPEPSTLFIAGFGLAGLAAHARRRRHARSA